jgi:hypothetical protein
MRSRLGQLLIQAGLLTEVQLVEALRQQVIWGARLGTVLSELGFVELDTLARVLGWQHEMPAALAKHFEHADRELQNMLGSELALRHGCIPLLRAGKRAVVASMSPLDETATEEIARQLGIAPELIVQSITPELRIRYQLERVYMISRPHRFLRSHGTEVMTDAERPTLATEAIPDLTDELDEVYPEGVLEQPSEPHSAERRTYLKTLADGVVEAIVDARERSASTPHMATRPRPANVLQALRSASDRGEVAELVIEAVVGEVAACRAATLLTVRGQAATSWTSFRRTGMETHQLAVALDRPGLARTVIQRGTTVRGAAGDLTEPDYLLLSALDPDEGDLIIAPITADGGVVALLVAAVNPGTSADRLSSITEAAGAAFARLMRDASGRTRTRADKSDSAPHSMR